jgi:hypothetical protein
VAWRFSRWTGTNTHRSVHALTLKLSHYTSSPPWWLTIVYGPVNDNDKVTFLGELPALRNNRCGPWLLGGDFNMIYRATDKNNARLNRRLMGAFHRMLQELELSELHLHGRLYTWSNERAHPTLEWIDKVFASLRWCDQYPHHNLRAASSSCSDHAPLLLHTNLGAPASKRFRFESFWPRPPGYMDAVQLRWWCTLLNVDACHVLNFKLCNTAKEPKIHGQCLPSARGRQ